jgi:methionine--tRNA ligase beta chain
MDTITIEDFDKLDIRVGQIQSVEAIPKAKKILKLEVSFGPEIGNRTILAGIAKASTYGEVIDGVWHDNCLVGQKIIAVVNLAPRDMFGFTSHGMLMAGHTVNDDATDKIYLISAMPLPDGTKVG